jgi:hypothetical protein
VEKPNHLPFYEQITKRVETIKRRLKSENSSNKDDISPITTKEIKTILKQLPNSSPGHDGIHNRCLKNYTTTLVHHLEKIFNMGENVCHHACGNAQFFLVYEFSENSEHAKSCKTKMYKILYRQTGHC